MLVRVLALVAALSLLRSPNPAAASPVLTLEERVAAQAAIERVYWAHRIWPQDNPRPKPPLEEVMPEGALRAKVEDYLRKSNALERWWSRPLTATQLQAELDRMAKQTRDPALLREIAAALGDDPLLMAECLARPALADRLLRSWYASDERFQGDLRSRVELALAEHPSVPSMKRLGGDYTELTYARGTRASADSSDAISHLDVGELGRLEETDEAFSVTALLAEDARTEKVATVRWPKKLVDVWWNEVAPTIETTVAPEPGSYAFDAAALAGCSDNTWSPTYSDSPDPRLRHTAVWTGAEMIVWGGESTAGSIRGGTGFRYNLAADTWTRISLVNAPAPRSNHTAVWTGTEMIVWGGEVITAGNQQVHQTGGRYNPASDTWTPTSTGANVPTPHYKHSAVWTGTVMVVWGGWEFGANPATGGRYNPTTDTWLPTSTGANAPSARWYHSVVWTGSEMIVWSGQYYVTGNLTPGGARYNPLTDSWAPMNPGNGDPDRYWHTAVWTGAEMLIFGGLASGTGWRYNPIADTWTPMSATNAPRVLLGHSAVWAGNKMVVWGGGSQNPYVNTGGVYDPAANSWTATSTGANVPTARAYHTAVWTGSEMILWGGVENFSSDGVSTGARYSPSSNTWVPTRGPTFAPRPRRLGSTVWTGSEMIVWGGTPATNSGSRYDPATDTWTATGISGNVPVGRAGHRAVWTGTEMIVFGGTTSAGDTNSGGRYNPMTNSWLPTSHGANCPVFAGSVAVWTGTEMIVWGGATKSGRYDPLLDAWRPVSLANAPSSGQVGVWTGSEMIVWGGGMAHDFYRNTGGRYSPTSDTWVPTSTGANVPLARLGHTAVWTGSKLIIWGGEGQNPGFTTLDTGGVYDPTTDTWAPTSTLGAPSARSRHTAVWTGTTMIVWGGGGETYSGGEQVNTGARYDPATNLWSPTSVGTNVPSPRFSHGAVRTSDRMIVWGGEPLSQTGGMYCALPCTPSLWYRDADGDGYGSATSTTSACDKPAGYVATSGDCDDASAAHRPGAVETCNLADDDCDGQVDEGFDVDLDGVTQCAGDCNDLAATVYPGAPQLCDGVNNDCSDPTWPTVPANEANADGDAYRICQGDCDDTHASVYPGAPQVCDGLDDNCNDPGWPAVPANEADADGDGVRICGGDCNDANPAIHPGAAETCNGIDDDCNSQIDEDAQGLDSDGDGVRNACDNCRFSQNPTQIDTDGDHVGNACDNCVSASNANQADTDGDGKGNACDNCPVNANATQDDVDTDLVGDACDDCLFDFNPSQADVDQDGEGDVCDPDDGLIWEFREDKTSVSWQAEQGPTSWNVYVGDLAVLKSTGVYTQPAGSNALAARHCGETTTFTDELGSPASGQVSFSLVTGVVGGIEGSLGNSSAGPRPNASPCP